MLPHVASKLTIYSTWCARPHSLQTNQLEQLLRSDGTPQRQIANSIIQCIVIRIACDTVLNVLSKQTSFEWMFWFLRLSKDASKFSETKKRRKIVCCIKKKGKATLRTSKNLEFGQWSNHLANMPNVLPWCKQAFFGQVVPCQKLSTPKIRIIVLFAETSN